MANYLTLVNNVLNELNEVELTSTTFTSSRGVQTMVKNVINKAINEIKQKHWDFFYECYLNTTGRKWGSKYLTKKFFLELFENFRDKILLIIAFKNAFLYSISLLFSIIAVSLTQQPIAQAIIKSSLCFFIACGFPFCQTKVFISL